MDLFVPSFEGGKQTAKNKKERNKKVKRRKKIKKEKKRNGDSEMRFVFRAIFARNRAPRRRDGGGAGGAGEAGGGHSY